MQDNTGFRGLYVNEQGNPHPPEQFRVAPFESQELMSRKDDETELHFHLSDGRRMPVTGLVHLMERVLEQPQRKFEEEFHVPGRTLAFGPALKYLQDGMRLCRQGWRAGQFVYLVPAASYPAQTGAAKAYFGKEAMVPYDAYFALKNAQGTVSVWTPTTEDLLAKDWCVIPTLPTK